MKPIAMLLLLCVGCSGGIEMGTDAGPEAMAPAVQEPEAAAPEAAPAEVDAAEEPQADVPEAAPRATNVTCGRTRGLGSTANVFCGVPSSLFSVTWDGGACSNDAADFCPMGTPCVVEGPDGGFDGTCL